MKLQHVVAGLAAAGAFAVPTGATAQNFIGLNALGEPFANRFGSGVTVSAIVGGANNTVNRSDSVVVGGTGNQLQANGGNGNDVIGGGGNNIVDGPGSYQVIVGGYNNKARNQYAVVVGGKDNTASGQRSSIPGGTSNMASGENSFAGGKLAVASGTGAFCWNDGTVPGNTAALNGQSVFSGAGGTYAFGQGVDANANALFAAQQGTGRGAFIQGNGTGRALEVNQVGGGFFGVNLTSNGTAPTLNVEKTGSATYVATFNGDVRVFGNLVTNTGTYSANGGNGGASGGAAPAGSIAVAHPAGAGHPDIDLGFVTSNEKRVVFEGSVTLDAKGEAVVELPGYTEGLCSKFVYHLTPVGEPAQLYVAEKVKDSKFKISGGFPDLEVSWSVSGLRTAAAAN